MLSHREIREAETESTAQGVGYDEDQDSQVATRMVLDDAPNEVGTALTLNTLSQKTRVSGLI
jgi:hypothetical protein